MNILSDCKGQLSIEYLVSVSISVLLAIVAAMIAWVIVDAATAIQERMLNIREGILTTVLK